jgi:hypothetical protein
MADKFCCEVSQHFAVPFSDDVKVAPKLVLVVLEVVSIPGFQLPLDQHVLWQDYLDELLP